MTLYTDNLSGTALQAELDDIRRRLGLAALDEALRFPQYFQIETVRVCNARCPFCAVAQWDKTVPVMPDPLFERIAAELAEHADWVRVVMVQRAGEPLMDKKIVARVKRLKDAGIRRVTMSTNAALLTEAKAVALLEAGLDEIMFSIDSIEREEYEKLRVRLSFDTVMANIRRFFALRNRLRPDFLIRVRGVCFLDPASSHDRPRISRWLHAWDDQRLPHDRIYFKRPHNWGNQHAFDGVPPYEEVFHPCVLPWSTLHVTTMGLVPLCPQDFDARMSLGDVNRDSIAAVWRGEGFARVRRLHREGKRGEISFCRGCRLFDEDAHLEKKLDALADESGSDAPLPAGARVGSDLSLPPPASGGGPGWGDRNEAT
ncbi:MAG: radical SAM protein [Candidatus Schekmanbacteria bacterium]|nr:radical SAM protein [Candidatus Schekmanbacteria bacterium]